MLNLNQLAFHQTCYQDQCMIQGKDCVMEDKDRNWFLLLSIRLRTERMMVRRMCGVSLKDRKCSVDLYSLLGVQSVDEVVRRGRSRWFGHVERKNGDDWVSACRNVVVAGVRCAGRGRLGMNV